MKIRIILHIFVQRLMHISIRLMEVCITCVGHIQRAGLMDVPLGSMYSCMCQLAQMAREILGIDVPGLIPDYGSSPIPIILQFIAGVESDAGSLRVQR